MIKDWKNKEVAILGFGVEGLSTARFLHKNGALVWILDKKKERDIDQKFLAEAEGLCKGYILGENYLNSLSDYDVIVRSPGISLNKKEIKDAIKNNIPVTSQTRIFFDLCPCPIIGVTGTKGKGTTSTLIYEMLKKSRGEASAGSQSVYLGGNIGIPPLDFLDKLTAKSIVVLELSSFQLQDLHKSPFIAVVLMITSEHLDYHGDIMEYVDAKRNILRYQDATDFAVINRDYPASNESDIYTEGKVFQVTRERATVEQGAFVKEDAIYIAMRGTEWKIIDTDKIALPGRHNLENAAAAAMAATLGGASKDDIVHVLKNFKGLPHRLELVREFSSVRYYDDSFSTTPETAIAAIEAFKEPEILILGGSSKNSDFGELAEVINKSENIKAIIGIGEEWEKIKGQIFNFQFSIFKEKKKELQFLLIEGAKDMETVVKAARKIAVPGDVVLLSPGCASFGMFKNYKDRGEQFKKEVEKLE